MAAMRLSHEQDATQASHAGHVCAWRLRLSRLQSPLLGTCQDTLLVAVCATFETSLLCCRHSQFPTINRFGNTYSQFLIWVWIVGPTSGAKIKQK